MGDPLAIGYFIFATSWSSMGLLLWRQGNDLNHMVIILLIGCTLAGNAALVGADKTLTILGYAIHGLAMVLVPLREGGLIYDGLSAMSFLYVCYLAFMSRAESIPRRATCCCCAMTRTS